MASAMYTRVKAELHTLGINTDREVHDFRIPGERRINLKSPTAGHMHTVITNVQTTLHKQWISRKQVRSLALRLLRERQL